MMKYRKPNSIFVLKMKCGICMNCVDIYVLIILHKLCFWYNDRDMKELCPYDIVFNDIVLN
jgi:hypothetical protein